MQLRVVCVLVASGAALALSFHKDDFIEIKCVLFMGNIDFSKVVFLYQLTSKSSKKLMFTHDNTVQIKEILLI